MSEGDRRSPGDRIVGNRGGLGRSMCRGLLAAAPGDRGVSCSVEVEASVEVSDLFQTEVTLAFSSMDVLALC